MNASAKDTCIWCRQRLDGSLQIQGAEQCNGSEDPDSPAASRWGTFVAYHPLQRGHGGWLSGYGNPVHSILETTKQKEKTRNTKTNNLCLSCSLGAPLLPDLILILIQSDHFHRLSAIYQIINGINSKFMDIKRWLSFGYGETYHLEVPEGLILTDQRGTCWAPWRLPAAGGLDSPIPSSWSSLLT